jgi:DTW domain-containing protein YfiP
VSVVAVRPTCAACRRPRGVCFCDRITILPTRTRILLLQHPREERVGIGTARMAHLALPHSRLRVGLEFADDPEARAAAGGPDTFVLFPGPDALPVGRLPRDRALTLVVLDGTWSQARKLLRLNPAIASLPRVAFLPRRPSGYLIRREPADFCVSTIEALAEVLRVIEPEGARFERLLDPFHAMVERQQWFESEVGSSRHLRATRSPRPSPRAALAARLAASWSRLVCIHGEANSWSYTDPSRQDPETVHWVAHRPATAETFEAVIAPRRTLQPATPRHVELPSHRLRAGGTLDAWHERWQGFVRPDDTLVVWGTFYRDLAAKDGLPLPRPTIDLREEAARALRRRLGNLDTCGTALGAAPTPLGLAGRGGRRLDALVGALEFLRDATPAESPYCWGPAGKRVN